MCVCMYVCMYIYIYIYIYIYTHNPRGHAVCSIVLTLRTILSAAVEVGILVSQAGREPNPIQYDMLYYIL